MNPRTVPRTRKDNQRVDSWNQANPPGTPVVVTLDDGSETRTTTRSEATLLGGHTAVVWLDGISGCYALDRCRPAPAAAD